MREDQVTTPAALLIAQAEALEEFASEFFAKAPPTMERAMIQAGMQTRALRFRHEASKAQPVEYLEIDWRTDGHDCTALSVFDSIEAEYRTTCGKPAPDAEMATIIRRVKHRLLDWFGSYREEIRAALQPVEEQAPRAGEREAFEAWCKREQWSTEVYNGQYANESTEFMLIGWQARSRQPEQVSENSGLPNPWPICKMLNSSSCEYPRCECPMPPIAKTSPQPAPALPADWVAVEDQPAPTDGLLDLWYGDRRFADCYYDSICDHWRTSRPSGHLFIIQGKPTHWKYAPKGPSIKLVGGKDGL